MHRLPHKYLQDSKAGKIKTESGVWIPATYKSNRYAEWKERTKVDENANQSDEEDEQVKRRKVYSFF